MAVQPGIWGIEIGQCGLKALRLEMRDGQPVATAFDYVEHPKILSQPDADPEQLSREALEQFLQRNPIGRDQVAISVPGQSGLARFVKLPPVEEKKITDIVRFEAKQQIPFPLEEVVWDYQKIGQGVVTDGFALETEVGLFAMKRDAITRSLSQFQNVGIEVHFVQMAPLVLSNFAAYDLLKRTGMIGSPLDTGGDSEPGKKTCVVALDVGTDTSNLVITDGARIIWQRQLSFGGNHFTRALTKDMKLTFAKAEHLKRNAAKSPDLPKILKSLKPVLGDFVNEVQRSLGFFTNTHRDATISHLVGLGNAFRLPGLQKFLAEKLALDVRKPTKFERLVGDGVVDQPVFTENLLTFPIAYGLALQGLGLTRLQTNLLPPEISLDRKIRAKKPWAAAAAACLLFGTGIAALGFSVPYEAAFNEKLVSSMKASEAKIGEIKNLNTQVENQKKEVEKKAENVRAIAAGKEQLPNWIMLRQYINFCLPAPGSPNADLSQASPLLREKLRLGNMGDDAVRKQSKYWASLEHQKAYERFLLRLQRGIQTDDKPDPERVYLPMIDLESIESRYTDNLQGFFENAKKAMEAQSRNLHGDDGGGMLKIDADTPPTGKGWVIEIRGSTFHLKGREFIIDTLVRNLTYGPIGAPNRTENCEPGTGVPKDQTDVTKIHPLRDRITHVFVYRIKQEPKNLYDNEPSPLLLTTVADYNVAAGGAAPGGIPGLPGGTGTAPAGIQVPRPGTSEEGGTGGPPVGDSVGGPSIGGLSPPGGGSTAGGGWVPLGGAIAGGGSAPGGMPGLPGLPGGPPGTSPTTTTGTDKTIDRHDFVILLVWREPVESTVGTTPATSATLGGGSGIPGTPSGPVGPPPGMGRGGPASMGR